MAERLRFQLRMGDLFWTTNLFGAAVGLALISIRLTDRPIVGSFVQVASGAFFGAGVGCLCKRPWVCALIGAILGALSLWWGIVMLLGE